MQSVIVIVLLGDVPDSTLVMKLNDACRERIISRKSILHFYSRKRRNLRTSSLRAAFPPNHLSVDD